MASILPLIAPYYSDRLLGPECWYHLAYTYDGSTLTMYADGDLEFKIKFSGAIGNPPQDTFIGNDNLGIFPLHAVVDEVRLWSVARSQEQVRATMNTRLSGDEPGLLAYWPFDEGQGQVVGDASGNGNDGQLGNSTAVDTSDPRWIPSDAPVQ